MGVREDVVDAVVEVCGTERSQLIDTATLESLGIDSLDLIEIAMIVEEQHDIQINGEDFQEVETFGDSVAVFVRVISTGSDT